MAGLPEEFDAVVLGTGLHEAVAAAALTRAEWQVLQIDPGSTYGHYWATLNLVDLQNLLKAQSAIAHLWHADEEELGIEVKASTEQQPGLLKLPLTAQRRPYLLNPLFGFGPSLLQPNTPNPTAQLCESSVGSAAAENEEAPRWQEELLLSKNREFNLDLTPKLLFACGRSVNLLIQSDVARYLEFVCVSRSAAFTADGELVQVPVNRSELFRTRLLSPREKRNLFRFLEWCLAEGKVDGESETLSEEPGSMVTLLSEQYNMNDLSQRVVLSSIALSTAHVSAVEGVRRVRRFLLSMQRFGPNPLLWPLYGSGELPQAFCRYAAVWGTLQWLGQGIDILEVTTTRTTTTSVATDESRFHCYPRCKALVLSTGDRIRVTERGAVLMHASLAPRRWLQWNRMRYLARALIVTSCSILSKAKEITYVAGTTNVTVATCPLPESGALEPAFIIELDDTTRAVPRGLYVIHVMLPLGSTVNNSVPHAHAILKPLLHMLLSDNRLEVVFEAYFTLPDYSETLHPANHDSDRPKNVFLLSGPDFDIDCDFAFKEANEIFRILVEKEHEFLSKPPDNEDIEFFNNNASEVADVASSLSVQADPLDADDCVAEEEADTCADLSEESFPLDNCQTLSAAPDIDGVLATDHLTINSDGNLMQQQSTSDANDIERSESSEAVER